MIIGAIKDIISCACNFHPLNGIGMLKLMVNKICYYVIYLPFLRGKSSRDLMEVFIKNPFNLTSYAFYSKQLNAAMFFYDSDSYLILLDNHESFLLKWFTPSPGDVVINVGAHIGKYTIFSSKRVGKHGKVIAIEAHPNNYEYLLKHLKINLIKNVVPINAAIDKVNGWVELYEAIESGWHSLNPVLLHGNMIKKKIRVPSKTLDTIAEELHLPKIDWIMIDVEGGEYNVLSGSIRNLKMFKPKVLIEIHTREIGIKVSKFLDKIGYNVNVVYGIVESGRYYIIARGRS